MKKLFILLFLSLTALCGATFSEAIETLKADTLSPMQKLVQTKEDANLAGEHNKTLLMYSVWIGDIKAVEFLLAKGADVNAQDANGKTALMLSLYKKYNDISLSLIHHNADLELVSDDNTTAFSLAGVKNKEELLKALE
jgi:ankyrin repeat protein